MENKITICDQVIEATFYGDFGSEFNFVMDLKSDNSAELVITAKDNQFPFCKVDTINDGIQFTIFGNMEHHEFLEAMAWFYSSAKKVRSVSKIVTTPDNKETTNIIQNTMQKLSMWSSDDAGTYGECI